VSAFIKASALGFFVLAALIVLAVEAICRTKGLEWRTPLYTGAAAGLLINLFGFPFLLKLAALPASGVREGECFTWWVGGMLARMTVIGVLMHFITGKFPGHEQGLTLALMAVYMSGMLAEVIWISKRFNAMDKR
jgi:hypothetical protein